MHTYILTVNMFSMSIVSSSVLYIFLNRDWYTAQKSLLAFSQQYAHTEQPSRNVTISQNAECCQLRFFVSFSVNHFTKKVIYCFILRSTADYQSLRVNI